MRTARRNGRRCEGIAVGAVAALVLLAVCGGIAGEAEPAPQAEPGPDFQFVECDGRRLQAYTQGTVKAPECDGQAWSFVLPGQGEAQSRRRSEVFALVDDAPYRPGDTVRFETRVQARLGDAASSGQDWHVLWQIIGRTDGAWKGPVMSLVAADGALALAGGNGHPDHEPDGDVSLQWNRRLAPFEDGRSYHLVIESRLHPRNGWVTVQVDGETVLDRYEPRTRDGRRPGTLYPGQREVTQRFGLYRGTDGGEPPAYSQEVRHDVEDVGRNGVNDDW